MDSLIRYSGKLSKAGQTLDMTNPRQTYTRHVKHMT